MNVVFVDTYPAKPCHEGTLKQCVFLASSEVRG